jgi:uncharacterized protein YggL (DUF469 family)
LAFKVPFKVVVEEGASRKKKGASGSIDLKTRTIYIHRYESYNDALRTFLHEVIEEKLNPVFKALLTMLNAQNDLLSKKLTTDEEKEIVNVFQQRYIEEQFYNLKERTIDELVELLLTSNSLRKKGSL